MTNITLPLDIKTLDITRQHVDTQGNITFDVESKCTETTCHNCKKPATKRYGHSYPIEVRHTSILDKTVTLRIKPVRYYCDECSSTTTEKYSWVAKGGKVTTALEDYILRCVINSTIQDVSHKENLSYRTISTVLNHRVGTEVDWSLHKDLNVLGIDEISDRKGYKDFIAIISTKDKHGKLSILAVLDDRRKETVKGFLQSIPEHLKRTVKSVCTDMYDGFVNSAIEVFGKQAVVVDRYHVSKLYRKPLDDLRIKEMARLKSELCEEEYSRLKDIMWILRKQHECLSEADKTKLELLYSRSPIMKQAHRYALQLTNIFNTHSSRKLALGKIDRWMAGVEKSDLNCFDKFIETLKKYKGSIANYFKGRKNSGFVEGLNNKIKVAKRRCYGFFKTESLFQRLTLDLSGYSMLGI